MVSLNLQATASAPPHSQLYSAASGDASPLSLEAFSSWSPLVSQAPASGGAASQPTQLPLRVPSGSLFAPAALQEPLRHHPSSAADSFPPAEYSAWTPFGGSQSHDLPSVSNPSTSSHQPGSHASSTQSGSHGQPVNGSAFSRNSWSTLLPQPSRPTQGPSLTENGSASSGALQQQLLHSSADRQHSGLQNHSSAWDSMQHSALDFSQQASTGWSPFGPASIEGMTESDSWQEQQLGPGILNGLLEQSSPPGRTSSSQHDLPVTCNAASGQPALQSNPFQLPNMYNTHLPSGVLSNAVACWTVMKATRQYLLCFS